jgi:hypothetical protein
MLGVVIYRYADVVERKQKGEGGDGEVGEVVVVGTGDGSYAGEKETVSDRSFESGSVKSRAKSTRLSRPLLMSTRSGIINSEYTGGAEGERKSRNISILFEGTMLESRAMQESHSSAPLISTSLPTENGRRGREIKSARKPPRLGSSFV